MSFDVLNVSVIIIAAWKILYIIYFWTWLFRIRDLWISISNVFNLIFIAIELLIRSENWKHNWSIKLYLSISELWLWEYRGFEVRGMKRTRKYQPETWIKFMIFLLHRSFIRWNECSCFYSHFSQISCFMLNGNWWSSHSSAKQKVSEFCLKLICDELFFSPTSTLSYIQWWVRSLFRTSNNK